jgi:putative hydrolase of the HAD superfamily
MIKNIILDVGMVLVDWDWETMFEDLGYGDDDFVFDALASATVMSRRWKDWDRGEKSTEERTNEMIMVAPTFENEILNILANIGMAVDQFDYTKPWIRAMKKAGYNVYLLSNYSKELYEQTREFQLDFESLVDGAVFSYQVHSIKPEKEIYQALLDKYDLKGEECVFIDDRQENLDAAAEGFGMKTVRFREFEQARDDLNAILTAEE